MIDEQKIAMYASVCFVNTIRFEILFFILFFVIPTVHDSNTPWKRLRHNQKHSYTLDGGHLQ